VPLVGSIACTYQAFRFGAGSTDSSSIREVGAEHVARWRDVPGYKGLAEGTGTDFDALMIELRRATPRLGALAGQLLQRRLHLAPLDEKRAP
jgi:hypothetical protein